MLHRIRVVALCAAVVGLCVSVSACGDGDPVALLQEELRDNPYPIDYMIEGDLRSLEALEMERFLAEGGAELLAEKSLWEALGICAQKDAAKVRSVLVGRMAQLSPEMTRKMLWDLRKSLPVLGLGEAVEPWMRAQLTVGKVTKLPELDKLAGILESCPGLLPGLLPQVTACALPGPGSSDLWDVLEKRVGELPKASFEAIVGHLCTAKGGQRGAWKILLAGAADLDAGQRARLRKRVAQAPIATLREPEWVRGMIALGEVAVIAKHFDETVQGLEYPLLLIGLGRSIEGKLPKDTPISAMIGGIRSGSEGSPYVPAEPDESLLRDSKTLCKAVFRNEKEAWRSVLSGRSALQVAAVPVSRKSAVDSLLRPRPKGGASTDAIKRSASRFRLGKDESAELRGKLLKDLAALEEVEPRAVVQLARNLYRKLEKAYAPEVAAVNGVVKGAEDADPKTVSGIYVDALRIPDDEIQAKALQWLGKKLTPLEMNDAFFTRFESRESYATSQVDLYVRALQVANQLHGDRYLVASLQAQQKARGSLLKLPWVVKIIGIRVLGAVGKTDNTLAILRQFEKDPGGFTEEVGARKKTVRFAELATEAIKSVGARRKG